MKHIISIFIVIIMLLLATFRGIAMLSSDPLIALANNYDMIRVEACIGAYPVRENNIPLSSNNPPAPFERYKFEPIYYGCELNSEVLFAFVAQPMMWIESKLTSDHSFSIRWVGAIKLATILILAWTFSLFWLWRGHELISVLNAFVVAVVLLDPLNTIYLNGFYAEFASVIFTYAAISGIALAINTKPGWSLLIFIGIAIIALCLSKIQHAPAGLALTIAIFIVWVIGVHISKKLIAILLVASIVSFIGQIMHIKGNNFESGRLANATNVIFTSIMPLSEHPVNIINYLKLPQRCAKYSGMSFWLPPISMKMEQHPCREAALVSHLRLLGLIWQEPSTMLRFFAGGIDELRPWLGNSRHGGWAYLGLVAGEAFANLPATWFSWSSILDSLSSYQFNAFLLTPFFIWLIFLSLSKVKPELAITTSVLTMLLFLAWANYFAVLFGNGYIDTAKVSNIMKNSLLAFWLIASAVLFSHLGYRIKNLIWVAKQNSNIR